MLRFFLGGALAAPAPSLADFEVRPTAREALQTRLSADGGAIAYLAWAPDGQRQVVARSVAGGGEAQVLAVPPDLPCFGPSFAGDVAYVVLGRGEASVRATWAGDGWRTDPPHPTPPKGFAAARERWIAWGATRGRTDLTLREGAVVHGSWTVRLGEEDRVLFDERGWPQAVVRGGRRGERLQPMPGEDRVPWPSFVPDPDPGPGPLDRRVLSRPVAFAEGHLWALDGRGLPHVSLVRYEPSGARQIALQVPDADLLQVSLHPDRGVPDLALAYRALPTWVAVDPEVQADLDQVSAALPGTIWRIDRARGDRRWHACALDPDAAVACLWFDRDSGERVLTRQEPLTRYAGPPPRTVPVEVPTSDGLRLDSFLVLPPGQPYPPQTPLPTVLLLHGGPYARARYEPSALRSLLAARGLAVLDFNFRGSTQQGVEVLTGADRQRGLDTQRDIREATRWLVEQGVADPERLALMGHSFGGYSTLLGLAQEPGRYRCGAALAPMAGWSYRWLVWALPRRQKDRLPYTQLEHLVDPVLLAHAVDDRVLPVSESRHVARALERAARPVTYLEFPEGGHDLGEHQALLAAAAGDFLLDCLAWAPPPGEDTPGP